MDLTDPTTVALLAAETFDANRLDYALYGGLLTAAYGEPRETRDADLAVVDVTATRARDALAAAHVQTLIAFENTIFGGLLVSRVTLLGGAAATGLNTIDLVRPRSARYAEAAVRRAITTSLRDRPIRVLTIEDFILFKILSTRDRDLEDARAALRRSAAAIDVPGLEHAITTLALELPDVDVRSRWTAVRTTPSIG